MSAGTTTLINLAPVVYVSAITGFELGIKYQKGKLELPCSPKEWLSAVLEHHDLQVLPLDMYTCTLSAELPAIHSDPCDRMIIAAAIINKLPIVTHDAIFKKYGIEVLE